MRQPAMLLAFSTLGACVSPMPPVDQKQAWVDLYTTTPGKVIMADRLDGKRLNDGRYFQVTPGRHELVVRFDYEVNVGAFGIDPTERTCYLTLEYDGFQAGQRYRLEARALATTEPNVRLYDNQRQVLAKERLIHCVP